MSYIFKGEGAREHPGFLKGRGPDFEMGANAQAARYKLQIL